jgi:hypothetical protein
MNSTRAPRQVTSRIFRKVNSGDWGGGHHGKSESRPPQQRGICTTRPLLGETSRSEGFTRALAWLAALLQSLTPPLSVGYVGFHGNWGPFRPESGLTAG